MKGKSLQRQFLNLKEELNDGGLGVLVKLQPRHGYLENLGDAVFHTEVPGKNWELVIDKKINECDSDCKNCKLCGLVDYKIRKFISCDEIWQLEIY